MRQRYEDLMAHPEQIEAILQQGAARARVYATDLIAKLRYAVGLRSFQKLETLVPPRLKRRKAPATLFKQYRESDGLFYFKLTHEAPNCSFPTASNPAATQASGSAASRRTPPLSPRLLFTSLKRAADNVVALLKSLAED